MSALYRKHRPQDFDQVVGQEHVVRTLRNAVASDNVAHAYLFAGPRGTGKTSLAKILAKALNCIHGPTVTPCKVCEACRAIHDATSIDVIELDAASHRGIDDIREIRDKVALRPAAGQRKVYIVDEAHMLTKEASNAVLKTLEEPPEHAVFILCTTELSSMLPTIRSRCQRFAFFRPGLAEIEEVLRRICAAEGIDARDGALTLVARSGAGSFRDAVSILDQLATAGGGTVTADDVASLLGTTDDEALFALLDHVAGGDAAAALRALDDLVEGGTDLGSLIVDLLGHLRRLFLVQQLGELPADAPVTADARGRLEDQAGRLGEGTVVRFVDLLRGVLDEVREGADPRLPLEITLVKVCRPQSELSVESLGLRVERLEALLAGGAPAAAPTGANGAANGGSPGGGAAVDPAPGAAARPASAGGLESIAERWSDVILPEIARRSLSLEALVRVGRPVGYGDGEVLLGFPRSKAYFMTLTQNSPQNLEVLRSVFSQAAGQTTQVRLTEIEDDEVAPAGAGDEDRSPSEGELLDRIKETFDAREVEETE